MRWKFPVALSAREQVVISRLKKAGRFYAFLREIRHELFDEDFQAKLRVAYGKARGTAPLPPALLAMVTLLQAYDQVSDADAVETAVMDLRWQLVLGCLGCEDAPFSQGVLVSFRERLIAHDLDKALLDRTVELAKRTGKFGWKYLKAALDSSPLLGAGRVEDTFNLIGRALSTVVDCAAKALRVTRAHVLREAKLTVLGGSSLKAMLDIDWDDPLQQADALARLLGEVRRLEDWVAEHVSSTKDQPPLREALELLRRVVQQDLDPDPTPSSRPSIRQGVAKDRIPSVGDPEMRHGRKSRKRPFTGYKRHIVKLLGTDLVVGALVAPANQPEHEAFPALWADAIRQGPVREAHVDRGYLGNPKVVELHQRGFVIRCKPWPLRNQGRFTKEHFDINPSERTVTCPADITVGYLAGASKVQFPRDACIRCSLRSQCTAANDTGRSLALHPAEPLLIELRDFRRSQQGRTALRERIDIEHSLARLGQIQGTRARYKGARKNSLDARRCAAVANLHALRRARLAA